MTCLPTTTTNITDISIYKNSDFNMDYVFSRDGEILDLSTVTSLKAEIRDKPGGVKVGEFVALVTDPTNGIAHLFMAQSDCAALSFISPAYYDIIALGPDGQVDKILPNSKAYLYDGVTN